MNTQGKLKSYQDLLVWQKSAKQALAQIEELQRMLNLIGRS